MFTTRSIAMHPAARPPQFKSQEFDALVEQLLKEWRIPGLAIALVDGDQTTVKVIDNRFAM